MINIEHTRYIGEIRRHSRANYPRIHSLRIQPQSSFQTQPLFGSSDACNLYIDFLDPAQHMNKKFISQSIHITLASVTPVMIFLRCMQSIYMSMPTHQDMSSRSIHLERRHSMPDREPLARLNLAQLRHETEPCMRGQNSKRGSTNTAKFMQATLEVLEAARLITCASWIRACMVFSGNIYTGSMASIYTVLGFIQLSWLCIHGIHGAV